ncbi:MAG: hypothetical protein GXO75_16055, partial [Calditrichaeota bacterium]|nr:hypothetical protein [Calditrichota bacterium]
QVSRSSVVFIHGGAIDDYVSYLLLTTMDNVELRAVIVTNTDSIARYAMQAQWKIQSSIKNARVPIGLSSSRGWNPFPWAYRSDSIRQHDIEVLADSEDNRAWPPFPSGDDLLHNLLSEAVEKDSPITILITSPLTTISDLLKKHPELEKGISRLIWVGGAIQVKGNLDKNTIPAEVANPEAEWNVFWDPHGANWIFENTSFPIVLFPLDVTNQASLTKKFKKKLRMQASSFKYSKLVFQSYMLTHNEPFYKMWNTVTTTYLAHPEFFDQTKAMRLIIITEGYDQGAMRQNPNGRSIDVVLNIAKKDQFYDYLLEQFKRDFKK